MGATKLQDVSGSVTLQTNSPADNYVVTLPNYNVDLTPTVLQVVYAELTTSGTGTGVIPHDATIPQNTEGNEILTCSITPKSTQSKLIITVSTAIGEVTNTGNYGAAALFLDSIADAIYTAPLSSGGDARTISFGTIHMTTVYVNADSMPKAFKLRVGMDTGAVRWNGSYATQYYGASNKTTITITEVM